MDALLISGALSRAVAAEVRKILGRIQPARRPKAASRPRIELLDPRILLSTATGSIYGDADANGMQNGSESALNGVTVYEDVNVNGINDAGDQVATTSGGGAYSISLTTAGNRYIIAQPGDGYACSTAPQLVDTTTSPTGINLGMAPQPVTSLSVSGNSAGTLHITWSLDSTYSGTVSNYDVARSSDSGATWSTLTTTSSTDYYDTTASTDTSYTYRVSANGLSFCNGAVSSAVLTLPDVPSISSVTPSGHFDLNVAFSSGSVTGTTIEVYREPASGGS